MVGMRFAEAGMMGRRKPSAEAGMVSDAGDQGAVVIGEVRSLCVKGGGTGGGALFGAEVRAVTSSMAKADKFARPGNAIAPCGRSIVHVSCVQDGFEADVGVGAMAVFSTLSTCAAVRVFLFGSLIASKSGT
jgi:hypothetical protein